MKQIFIGLMLLGSISRAGFAQSTNDYPFNIPPNSTNRYFSIDLGKGNKVEFYANNVADLDKFKNMDSIIYGFLKDINNFKDSLSDERTIKRIDYNLDDGENRKLRITQYRQAGQSFLIKDDEIASLKIAQDTVNFVGKVNFVADYAFRKKYNETRYYKAVFLVNNVADLSEYMNNIINGKISSIQKNINKKWENNDDRTFSPVADPSIKSNAIRGYNSGGDYLSIGASVEVQNYKANFVPSVSFGAAVILGSKNIRRVINFNLEQHFSFGKDVAGSNRTYINQFLTLGYSRGYIRDNDIKKNNYNLLNVSVAYLIRQRGPLYEKGTTRLGVGALSIFEDKTKIQPVLYFTDFFKGVTPGIRWVQSF
ncbi:MAG: hypothetical protein H7Y86_03605 [Rhizobacter sp.]|nr:hypothetical protein [Ferruginibacter sp.]